MGAQDLDWLEQWLARVAAGSAKMSQRRLSSVEAHGGLQAAVTLAQSKGVHLVRLTDDKGVVLVAASRTPFETLC